MLICKNVGFTQAHTTSLHLSIACICILHIMDCPQIGQAGGTYCLVQKREPSPQKPTTCCQVILLGGYTKVGVHSTAWPVLRPRDEGLGGILGSPIPYCSANLYAICLDLFFCVEVKRDLKARLPSPILSKNGSSRISRSQASTTRFARKRNLKWRWEA